ncbi:AAA family ATPase [Persicitalea sp.]|uniref:AAA family ATPase n=1 Tax=Persicitalea sp. TaxID=3100273 RepID=UPI0035939FD1
MKLQKLHIKNYKSLVDLEIVEPNPFTVFAGPNGAGKSNIFEALEFAKLVYEWNGKSALRLFGGRENIKSRSNLNRYSQDQDIEIGYLTDNFTINFKESEDWWNIELIPKDTIHKTLVQEGIVVKPYSKINESLSRQYSFLFFSSFSRIFVKNSELVRIKEISDEKLSLDCSNLETVLKRLLEDKIKREDVTEYLELFIPGFEKIEIDSNNLSGTDTLLIYEKGINKPFTKDLISDGTYNILCLLTAVFQSDEPQFLCIEEPENGLNPYVVQEFVELCRLMCEDYEHYIWLNTHSQTLIRALKEEELILVDKENGATKIKQFEPGGFYDLKADEALLTNSLGAGIPW